MNRLVWKLLRQHISIGQLGSFIMANIFGMVIVLLSVQFYKDVLPVFTEGDSFMKKDFIIATKRVSTLGSLAGKSSMFSPQEAEDLKKQPFYKKNGHVYPFPISGICRDRHERDKDLHQYGYVFRVGTR